jgi:hypothetical protein
MINNLLRNGNFTSSTCVALLSTGSREMTTAEMEAHKKAFPKSRKKNIESWPGKAAITYISECNFERRLQKSLDKDTFAKPLIWGCLVEGLVFDLLGMEYILTSSDTEVHPIIPWWVGSKDGIKHDEGRTVMDIKAPFTEKSFCMLVEPIYRGLTGMDAMRFIMDGDPENDGEGKHPDGKKFYWQIVSNACISNCKYGELVVYCPYQSELPAIRFKAMQENNDSRNYWLSMANDDELPFIPDDGFYKNINIIRFEIPEGDKQLLTKRMLQGGKLLIDNPDADKFDESVIEDVECEVV